MNNHIDVCPAARLAREAVQIIEAHFRGEEAGDYDAVEDLAARREAIETAASWVRAPSTLGAYFQALTLFDHADEMNVCFSDDPNSRRAGREMRRLAASIIGQLEASVDPATVETLRSFYMSRTTERAVFRAA
jgi:hypothetical protein